MGRVRRIVLDVLKPHKPNAVEMATRLTDVGGVLAVNISVYEVDLKVENVKLTLAGESLVYPIIRAAIESLGAAVHSIDEVVAGERVLESPATPQD